MIKVVKALRITSDLRREIGCLVNIDNIESIEKGYSGTTVRAIGASGEKYTIDIDDLKESIGKDEVNRILNMF